MRVLVLVMLTLLLFVFAVPTSADQINYVSQPEEVVIFLNNIAYVRDTLRIPNDAEARIVLPQQIYQDALLVHQGDARLNQYRISRTEAGILLTIAAGGGDDLRDITLEYLTAGIGWKPVYDMTFTEEVSAGVDFHFFAEVHNEALTLDNVAVTLAAGRVSTTEQIDAVSTVTTNQYIAGYEETETAALTQGAVTIQYVYSLQDVVTADPGETLYTQLFGGSLPARRLLLWNAMTDPQVAIIYKVENASGVPLTEGIVRSYQDGLFVGSDFVEFTPVGSEGSVTVGALQDVRVDRAETITYHEEWEYDQDTLHDITLTLSSFSADAVDLEVVDFYPPDASKFEFSAAPEYEPGNQLRWQMTVPAGETVEIVYSYRAGS